MAISVKHPVRPIVEKSPEAPSQMLSSRWNDFIRGFSRPVNPSELIFFTSQLSLMIEIGTPLNLALKAIKDQTDNTAFKEVIETMRLDVEEGLQLSDAMKRHPRFFSSVFTNMTKAGESGGFLKDIMDRIVEIQEKRQALITQLRSALTYPLVLCVVAALVVVFIMVGVLPKFTSFFMGKEDILPATTRYLMALSAFLRSYWWALIAAGVALTVSLKLFMDSKKGHELKDWIFVSFPLIARLSNKIYTCQLLRTLGHLMGSHVPLIEALEVTRGTINNLYFRRLIDQITVHVQEGGKFSQPFAGYPYALASVKQMVATGEEAGNLPMVMLRLAEFYDAEVDRELKIFSSMIEPIALIVLGAVIGLIVSSVILPLFKLSQVLH